jgi:hypothetical protein
MQADSQPGQFFWALTPNGWVLCDGFDSRPADAVVVTRVQPAGVPDLETGLRSNISEEARFDEAADKDALIRRFGRAPQYPIPAESVAAITEKVTRLVGLRGQHGGGAWDELRNALIEARYLRGVVSGRNEG